MPFSASKRFRFASFPFFRLFLLVSLGIAAPVIYAQDADTEASRQLKATDFAIPSSTAFVLLNDNTPARIQRMNSLHDLKVDWSFGKDYALQTGLGIELAPVWMLLYDKGAPEKYKQASYFLRTLSSLSVSVASNSFNDRIWFSWGAKVNLYRQADPLLDNSFVERLQFESDLEIDSLRRQYRQMELQQRALDKNDESYPADFQALDDSIWVRKSRIYEIRREQGQQTADLVNEYVQANWNASFFDLALGQLYSFKQIAHPLPDLVFVRNGDTSFVPRTENRLLYSRGGSGVWLSGGLKVGMTGQIGFMAQYRNTRQDLLTPGSADSTGVSPELWDRTFSFGTNFRYGNRKYNVFAEYFFDVKKLYSEELIPPSNPWSGLSVYTLGGDWRISRNVMLSFGLRVTRPLQTRLSDIEPVINLNCLMR
jgi:hypothetical protein